jgi:hypothetical protein
MKKPFLIFCILFVFSLGIPCSRDRSENFSVLRGPYLGQKPPGMTPEVFAPGIISKRLSVHSAALFSPDGNEVYWTVMNDPDPFRILFMKRENNVWSRPEEVPFSGAADDTNPFFSAEGKTLFFKSTRGDVIALWKTEREKGTWSDPKNLGSPFSNQGLAWQASVTREGVIYFVKSTGVIGSHDIYRAGIENGAYGPAEKIASPVNSDIDDWQVFIDPDEEYIIFGRWQPSNPQKQNGLYISFKMKNGSWSKPVNLGKEINGDHGAYWPSVTTDKKYLFFVSDMDNGHWHYDVYWVDARIIEELKSGK